MESFFFDVILFIYYIYIYLFFLKNLFPFSLLSRVPSPCWLSTYNIPMCACQSQSPTTLPLNSHSSKVHSLMFTCLFLTLWSIVDLQCCVSFTVQQGDSVMHSYISTLFQILFPYRSLQSIEQSSLCCMQYYSYCISYLFYIQYCVYVNPNLPIYHSLPFPSGNHKFFIYICDSITVL